MIWKTKGIETYSNCLLRRTEASLVTALTPVKMHLSNHRGFSFSQMTTVAWHKTKGSE